MHYALGEIPGADRNVLSLAYLRGLSHPATAALLDIPRETVQARVVGSLWALCHAI
jgi:DNA-directed RNA polymerase specialized sigma24 family protein